MAGAPAALMVQSTIAQTMNASPRDPIHISNTKPERGPVFRVLSDAARARHDPGSGQAVNRAKTRAALGGGILFGLSACLCLIGVARAQNAEDILPLTNDPNDPI